MLKHVINVELVDQFVESLFHFFREFYYKKTKSGREIGRKKPKD